METHLLTAPHIYIYRQLEPAGDLYYHNTIDGPVKIEEQIFADIRVCHTVDAINDVLNKPFATKRQAERRIYTTIDLTLAEDESYMVDDPRLNPSKTQRAMLAEPCLRYPVVCDCGAHFSAGLSAQRVYTHTTQCNKYKTTTEFVNRDGITATPADLNYVHGIMSRYPVMTTLRGKVGYSELGMHTRTTEKTGIVAFIKPENPNYAYVLLDDGTMIDGRFTRFDDGRFSLT